MLDLTPQADGVVIADHSAGFSSSTGGGSRNTHEDNGTGGLEFAMFNPKLTERRADATQFHPECWVRELTVMEVWSVATINL